MYVISKDKKIIKEIRTKILVKKYLKSNKSTKGIKVYEKVKSTQKNLDKARRLIGAKRQGKSLLLPINMTYIKKYW